jgi:dihydrofolate synthase / folylpolyglutamate synthase
MMTLPDDQARIDAIEKALLARWPESRIEPTLERISALMDILGSPQLTYPTIHIAGTNGKTTTTRMIDSLLFETGMRTGRFTSPHLESYLERIAINGKSIDAKEMIFAYNDIAAYLDLMDEKFEHPISFFEAITALAFVAFAEHPVDVGIIEVGMGGTWDATNVIDADVSVIMPIDLDHTEYLGTTLTEIASTKAGVIKEGGFVVLAQQKPEAAIELLKRAAEVGADIAREGIEYELMSRAVAVGGQLISIKGINDTYEDIFLPLYGKHQAANAASALVAVEAFFGDQPLDIESVRAGFAAVTSPGRCEIVHRDPTIILDAAHNPHGASALAESLETEFTFDEKIGVIAIFADKDAAGVLKELEPVLNSIIVTQSSSTRAMPVAELEKIAVSIFGNDRVFPVQTLEGALDRAVEKAQRPLSDDSVGVVVTGSVVTVGEARTYLRKKFNK